MRIRLLGTGGADGIPGMFSRDRVSEYARKHGGRDVRTRSAALVDSTLKIDLPPDTLCQLTANGLNPLEWSALVFTHSHEDHFTPSEIQYALYPFTALDQVPFQIFGNQTIRTAVEARYPDWPIDFVEFVPFQSSRHGEYTITPFLAHHVPDEDCFNLVIERDRTLVYATDTGIWAEPSFQFLCSIKADCLVIECTEGLRDAEYDGHLNVARLGQVLEKLRAHGTVSDQTLIITTHHSHTGDATHDELTEALRPLGAVPGFDGEIVSF